MFKKILIANRGEIALRIIRTCHDMGIKTIAIYSEADRTSPHVIKANEAYCVGPAQSSKSYMNVSKILDIVKQTKADAIHPGYGFLSENAIFAKKTTELGVVWIGPSSKVITIMGDKMQARKFAVNSKVPIVPGTTESLIEPKKGGEIADKIGFPVLIKAAGGGGGKGMRIIQSKDEMENAMSRSKSEAQKSFSDDKIYIEKYLEESHHIEIQIFADNYGNVVSLGERECSIQRRYQKLFEETPSPFIDAILRAKLSQSAIKITKNCHYSGAGTVEFLVDKYKNFYFLEMNTRLQVEHPITEMVTGFDLVKEQIRVAAGEKLSFTQNDIQPKGHAMECRVYAEDGFNNFSPSSGRIHELYLPHGIGVRLDEGIHVGQQISPYYDSLLVKLITWGKTRNIALNRMSRALNEFHITGVSSTIPFCLMLLQHQTLQKGQYSTFTLNAIKSELIKKLNINKLNNAIVARIGAIKYYQQTNRETNLTHNQRISNKWTLVGRKSGLR